MQPEDYLWYFAYGSNMDSKQMAGRVGRCDIEWRTGYVQDYKLVFNKPGRDNSGKANIEPCPGEVVWGVLYKLTREELEKLDKHEGVGSGDYYRKCLKVTLESGEIVVAECYFACKTRSGLKPNRDYLERIISGGEEHGLPKGYVERLRKFSEDDASDKT